MGIGTALGVTAAALLAQIADWHLVFWVVAAVGAASTAGVALVVPPGERRTETQGSFDWVGAATLSVGLVLVLLALTHASSWTAVRLLWVGGAGAVVLLLWARHQLGRRNPLVDLRTTGRRGMVIVNLVAMFAGVVMFTHVVALPQLLQDPRWAGRTVLQAGLCLVPAGLTMMVAASVSGRFTRVWSNRAALSVGLGLAAAGYGISAVRLGDPGALVAATVVIGAGVGLAFAVMPGP